ncbi:MAG: hypothetical protein H6563_11070 [Lewinellaceae bacterium]|nr:hypothetical protein [Lewinellaceae bacterium]
MKNLLLTLFLSALFTGVVFSQKPLTYPPAVLSLAIEQSSGTNGSAVAWNPTAGLYYALIAGNSEYPLEVFNQTGGSVRQMEAGIDLRGLWWNPKAKALQGNCPGETGWVQLDSDNKGIPTGSSSFLVEGEHQPDFQSVAAFDAKKKKLVFYNNGALYLYNAKNGAQAGTVQLPLPVSQENINFTTVGFTGKKNYEYVLLDYDQQKLYFFNRSGAFTAESQLPYDAVTNDAFRFSFANGIAFLYDAEERVWTGYKVF